MNWFHQQGLTMIELLVTLALSSFLVLGVTRLFADSVSSAKTAQDLGYVSNGGALGSLFLNKHLSLAGYENYFQPLQPSAISNSQRVIANSNINDQGGVQIAALDGGVNDAVVIQYDAPQVTGTQYQACDGTSVAGGERVREAFWVDGSQLLVCALLDQDNNLIGAPAQLVAQIEGFQIRYGLADQPDDIDVSQYFTATQYANVPDADGRLRSIQYAMLIRSDQGAPNTGTQQFTLLEQNITVTSGPIYRTYANTVVLHNANRGRLIQ